MALHLSPLNELDLEAINREFPNARKLSGGLFVSHSGRDFQRILGEVDPALKRFQPAVFLHNRGSGGSSRYKRLVQAALYYCPYFLVVISENSVQHDWVTAEVDWAFKHGRAIMLCLFDNSKTTRVHPELRREHPTADFRRSTERGRRDLTKMFDAAVSKPNLL
jgi:TIR domain